MVLAAGQAALAHGTGDGAGVEAAAPVGTVIVIEVAIVPDAPPPVARVALGARVRLVVTGAGGRELHLHGYDIEASAPPGAPVTFAFDAVHEGRFGLEMHVADDLLGAREKPVLWIEVRAP